MKHLILIAIILLFFLSGCTHYHYSPNTLQIPMLQKQHDASISIARYTAGEVNGGEAQAIYSPVKYAGVMFNHMKIPRKTNGTNDIGYEIAPEELASIRNIESEGTFRFWEKGFSLGVHLKEFSLTFNKVWLSSRKYKFEVYQFNKNGSNICATLNINALWLKQDNEKIKQV